MKKAVYRELLVRTLRSYNERLQEITLERDFFQKQFRNSWLAGGAATLCFGISLAINFYLILQ